MIHWLRLLWDSLWPNMFAPSLITLAWVGILHLRTRLRLHRVQATADAAHQIAADTHKHLTGQDHPAAPAKEGT